MKLQDNNSSRGHCVGGIALGLSLIICTIIISVTAIKVKSQGQTISVTGAAYKPITSDYATWSGRMTVTTPTLEAAYAKIKDDLVKVKLFLAGQGFDSSDYTVGTINLRKIKNREQQIVSYNLGQTVEMELPDVKRVTQLAKDASSLIEQGVEFESRQPSYIFTGLDALKIEMIKRATENAKLRAQQLAESTGMNVGSPRSARVGVFQIRPLHSQAVSDYGVNDHSSLEKEIGCTVHISFQIN